LSASAPSGSSRSFAACATSMCASRCSRVPEWGWWRSRSTRTLTPTEIEHAWRAGAALVKLFPGALGGPGYVKDVLAPLGDVPLIVTGRVDAQNARAFLDAGAIAVGIGSALGDDPAAIAALRAALA